MIVEATNKNETHLIKMKWLTLGLLYLKTNN